MYPLKLEAVPMYSKKNWFSLVQVIRKSTKLHLSPVCVCKLLCLAGANPKHLHLAGTRMWCASYLMFKTSSIVCNARNSKLVDVVLKYDLVTRKSDSVKGLTAVTRSFPNICVFLV